MYALKVLYWFTRTRLGNYYVRISKESRRNPRSRLEIFSVLSDDDAFGCLYLFQVNWGNNPPLSGLSVYFVEARGARSALSHGVSCCDRDHASIVPRATIGSSRRYRERTSMDIIMGWLGTMVAFTVWSLDGCFHARDSSYTFHPQQTLDSRSSEDLQLAHTIPA